MGVGIWTSDDTKPDRIAVDTLWIAMTTSKNSRNSWPSRWFGAVSEAGPIGTMTDEEAARYAQSVKDEFMFIRKHP